MSNARFPHVYGLAWEVKKSRNFKTLMQAAVVPGFETRVPLGSDPLYRFTLKYKVLFQGGARDTLAQIEDFFNSRQGSYDSFLLSLTDITKDPEQSRVTRGKLTLDANGNAPLVRVGTGGYSELIYELARNDDGSLTVPVIYQDDTPLAAGTDYTLYAPTQTLAGDLNANGINYSGYVVHFTMSPLPAGIITADFGFWYRVRFDQDALEFDQFHYLLWEAQQIDLVGTRDLS